MSEEEWRYSILACPNKIKEQQQKMTEISRAIGLNQTRVGKEDYEKVEVMIP